MYHRILLDIGLVRCQCLKYALVFQAVCTDGTLFNHLETLWRFTPGAGGQTESCNVEFFVSSATGKYRDTRTLLQLHSTV